jgi:hypothetical protein
MSESTGSRSTSPSYGGFARTSPSLPAVDECTFFDAYLVPEPENPYGRNGQAVRVESARGQTIGHLSNGDAERYEPVFAALHAARRVAVCRAVAVGGSWRKSIGVWISTTIQHGSLRYSRRRR